MEEYKTVRGFLSDGKSEPDGLIFKYSAAIRLGGPHMELDMLNNQFGVKATYTHKCGEKKGMVIFNDDMWMYETVPVISEFLPLENHLQHLNEIFLPHINFLKQLQDNQTSIKIYTSYYSNCDHAGIEVTPSCLQLYVLLNQPFGVGINFLF